MNDPDPSFETELRMSPKPILVALVLLGGGFYFGAEMLLYPWQTVDRAVSLFLMLVALSGVSWALFDWKPLLGRWATLLTLSAALVGTGWWLRIPGALAWTVIPTALAVPLIGFPAAAATALVESAIVVALMRSPAMGAGLPDATVALGAIWGVFGALYAVSYQMHQRSEWYDRFFARAQRSLLDAQDRRVELRQALDDLTHANRQLTLMNERVTALRTIAEEARKAKTTFVAKVSHEFRTPLNMIVGLVDLMVETPEIYDVTLSPRMREALQVVYRNSQHLSEMVNDVLDLTRIEADRVVLHKERVSIGEVINSAAEAVRPLLESKQLQFSVLAEDDVPEVYCDRTRVEQVLLNLVSNAARYTEQGSIAVRVAHQDSRIQVSVADTGPGIAPKDIDRVFEPFCQGTSELWRHKGGSGLGLSISKQFIELHGGRMWVESELGVGTTFSFDLPMSPDISLIARPGHQIREDWVWRERRSRPRFPDTHYNPRFVICDRWGSLYRSLVPYSDTVELVNVQEAMEVSRALQESPAHAVVFNAADIRDASTTTEMISQEAPGTPVIGCCVPPRVERAMALGALGHLIKPVTRADLGQALQKVAGPVRRVLLVDDDPDALVLFGQMLHVCDSTLDIVTASSGQEALEQLRRAPPDFMLLDVVMPDLDGWQVLAAMGEQEDIPQVPTFVVSAQDPADQPIRSDFLLVRTDGGLSLSRLLGCSLEVSKNLLEPEGALHPAL